MMTSASGRRKRVQYLHNTGADRTIHNPRDITFDLTESMKQSTRTITHLPGRSYRSKNLPDWIDGGKHSLPGSHPRHGIRLHRLPIPIQYSPRLLRSGWLPLDPRRSRHWYYNPTKGKVRLSPTNPTKHKVEKDFCFFFLRFCVDY